METLGRLCVGDCDAFPSWSRCFVLCLMLEIGVTVLVRLMVWFALVHLCLTLGSLWTGLILVVVDLTRWFMRGYSLVRVGGFGGGWLIILLFLVFWWCDCDSLVNRMKWLWWRGGVGWIVIRWRLTDVSATDPCIKPIHDIRKWTVIRCCLR